MRVTDDGTSHEVQMASAVIAPLPRAAIIAKTMASVVFGGKEAEPAIGDALAVLQKSAAATRNGDLSAGSDMLVGHAATLDALFTELSRRAIENMGSHLPAAETYFRLAMKAQAQARMSIETLAKMHQPREQVVRHVHVYEGGQAVVAEEFHHHAGGNVNAGISDRPHGPGARGTALLSENTTGNGVPVSSGARKGAMSHARRSGGKRRAEGK